MTIKEYITQQFGVSGYEVLSPDVYKHTQKNDFWLVVEEQSSHEQEGTFLERQDDLYHELEDLCSVYKEMEKNTSLLYLVNLDGQERWSQEEIIQIESDELFFKKYVITYTQEAWNELSAILQGRLLKDLILDSEFFEKYRQEETDGPYTLFYTLVHKLLFVDMDVQKMDLQDVNLDAVPDNLEDLNRWMFTDNPMVVGKSLDEIKEYLSKEQ
jgi:hypothetical protein